MTEELARHEQMKVDNSRPSTQSTSVSMSDASSVIEAKSSGELHELEIRRIELEIRKMLHLREAKIFEAKLKETEAKLDIEKMQLKASNHSEFADLNTLVENANIPGLPAQAWQLRENSMRKEDECRKDECRKERCETNQAETLVVDTLQQQ